MDNRYYDNVINEMKPFLDENNFVLQQDGSFLNDSRKVAVNYNDAKQSYTLSVAQVEDGQIGEEKEINSWLFDDSQTAKDASSVGIDFTSSLRKDMGIKLKRSATAEVELPSFSKGGSLTITGFAKKMLDFFPALKDEYKAHVAKYGNFLYLNFFGEHLVPKIKAMMDSDNKKQIKKFFSLLDDIYVKGDKNTVNTVVALLCAAAYKDEKTKSVIAEMLTEDKHFLASFENFLPVFGKNKKILSALIK